MKYRKKNIEYRIAFLAIRTNNIKTEKHKSKSQINTMYVRGPAIAANVLHE